MDDDTQNHNSPQDEAVSFVNPEASLGAANDNSVNADSGAATNGFDFSQTTESEAGLAPASETNPQTVQTAPTDEIFIGKSVATSTKTFGKNKTKKFYVRPMVVLMPFIILGIMAGAGYVAWRVYKDGPEVVVNFFRGDSTTLVDTSTGITRLVCERQLDSSELIALGNANQGTEKIIPAYDRENNFISITKEQHLVYSDVSIARTSLDHIKANYQKIYEEYGAKNDPFTTKYNNENGKILITNTAIPTQLTKKNADYFHLLIDNGKPVTAIDNLRRQYNQPRGNYTCKRITDN